MSGELLGGHVQVVESLLDRLAALQAGDRTAPRVVVLRGASGTGKSRIIQEVYARLREESYGPGYWPVLPAFREHGDPLIDRKWISPDPEEFIWPSGALPTFGWWGVNCERLQRGVLQNVVTAIKPQLDAHLLPLTLARWGKAGLLDRTKETASTFLNEVRRFAINEAKGKAVNKVVETAGQTIPFATTLVNWGVKGFQAADGYVQQLEALHAAVDVGQNLEDVARSAGSDLAGVISSLVHPDLPTVVAIEDMHLMGPDLEAMVEAFATPTDRPVLVIGAVWPEGQAHVENRHYQSWSERNLLLGRAEIIDVPDLGAEDLETLLREYAPATQAQEAHQIVTAISNPLFLKTWLSSPAVQLDIQDLEGAVKLGEGKVKLPRDIEQVIGQRWDALDKHLQWSLVFAATANPLDDPTCQFLPEVVTRIAADFIHARPNIVHTPPQKIREGLAEAVDPAAWCRLESRSEFFTDQTLASHARAEAQDKFSSRGQSIIQQFAQDRVAEWLHENAEEWMLPAAPESLIASLWLLTLTDSAEVTEDEAAETVEKSRSIMTAQAIAHIALATSAASIYHYTTAITHNTKALHLLRQAGVTESSTTLTLRHSVASWLSEIGRVQEAIEQFSVLVEDLKRVLGPDHPHTLATRNNLATSLGKAGQVEDAVEQYRALFEDRNRVLGPDHPDTLMTRNNLASRLADAGQVEKAVEQVVALLEDQARVLGPDHPHILTTRNSLAIFLGKAVRVEEAVKQLVGLLEDQARVLGPDHPDTLQTRFNLASLRGEAGRVEEAVEQLVGLLEDQTRVLGPDHPHILQTRHNLASLLGKTRQVEKAVGQFLMLLDGQARVLGPDHPDTLQTRFNLASLRGMAGQVEEAVEQLVGLLEDQTRVLGPDHPHTLDTRYSLTTLLGKAGQVGEAVEQLLSLLEDQTRVLGPDHPHTLDTRHSLAHWSAEMGHLQEAVEQFSVLLEGRTRVLGPDHPDTLVVRNNLVTLLGEMGHLQEALEQASVLLEDATRALGPDHPDTLAIQDNLIYLEGKAE